MTARHYVAFYEEGTSPKLWTAEQLRHMTGASSVTLEWAYGAGCGESKSRAGYADGHAAQYAAGQEASNGINDEANDVDNVEGTMKANDGVRGKTEKNASGNVQETGTYGQTQASDGGQHSGEGGVVVHPLPFAKGQTVAQAVYLSGRFAVPSLCSGLGRCGHCQVRVVGEFEGRSAIARGATDSPPFASKCSSFSTAPLSASFLATVPVTREEEEFFPAEALAQGWRLGCRQLARQGQLVLLPEHTRLLPRADAPDGARGAVACQWIALDVGTTSVHWRAYGYGDGQRRGEDSEEPVRCLDGGAFPNPQMGAGSEVVSRIQMALSEKGKERLVSISHQMLRAVLRRAGGAKAVFLAANPAMAGITLGQDISSLAHAPYALPEQGGDWVQVEGLPPIWVVPHMAPFVGGDISAGYAYLVAQNVDYPFLLADMGTNGEFVLALSPTRAFVTSVALGPALEGINLAHGSVAQEGVIVDFSFSPLGFTPLYHIAREDSDEVNGCLGIPDGRLADYGKKMGLDDVANIQASRLAYLDKTNPENTNFETRNSARSRGDGLLPPFSPSVGMSEETPKMSGTAYLSLLSKLIDGRALSREGHFIEGGGMFGRLLREVSGAGGSSLRGGRGETSRRCQHEPYFPLPRGMALFASDVEEILKVKAAFSLGLSRLLEYAGVPFHTLRRVYLAGALGRHVDTMALENLGFFPPGAHERLVAIGNSALAGTVCLAQDKTLRRTITEWASTVTAVNLADDPMFHDQFVEHMVFRYVETEG